MQALVGDIVAWQRQPDGTFIVEQVMERNTTLTRSNARGEREALAANVTQLLIVVAAEPTPDWFMLDRYLVATELMDIDALIVFNKIDLVERLPAELEIYRSVGYTVLATSSKRAQGIPEFRAAMCDERSAVVGQSGVGKSSLINALLGQEAQTVGSLSDKGKQGRHTTSSSTLYRLPGGAELIDSPGVRGFAPYLESPEDVVHGFREFRPWLDRCRFDDCRHDAEPDCAIKAAVAQGDIDTRRYASYLRLREVLAALRER